MSVLSGADELEVQRILGLYKRLVLLGQARIPLAEGRRLVGPDCAFHLYFRQAMTRRAKRRSTRNESRRRRR